MLGMTSLGLFQQPVSKRSPALSLVYLSVTRMDHPDKPVTATSTKTRDEIRHRVASSSLSRTLSLYAVSFLFLAAVVVGFIWHNLRGAYRDTVTYWNARLSSSAEDRVSF